MLLLWTQRCERCQRSGLARFALSHSHPKAKTCWATLEWRDTTVNNATNHLPMLRLWNATWSPTMERSPTIVNCAINHSVCLLPWRPTSSLTLGRGSTSVRNATIHLTKQEISDNICSFTVAKRASLVPNAANLSIGLQDLKSTCSSIVGRRHTGAHSACFQRTKRVVFRNTFQLIIGKSHLCALIANSPLIRKRFWTATKWPTEGRVNRNVLSAIFQQTQKVAFKDTSTLAIYCGRQAKNRDGSY